MTIWKLGCRWGSHTPLFYDFIKENKIVVGWIGKEYKINDWILVADGHTILAFAKVIQDPEPCLNYPDFKEPFENLQIPFTSDLFVAKTEWIELKKEDRFTYELQQGICKVHQQNIKKQFQNLLKRYTMDYNQQTLIDLLVSKKQIILQGPPGTGKTFTAQEIANKLIKSNKINFDNNLVKDSLKIGLKIQSAGNKTEYEIISVDNTKCSIKGIESKEYSITFQSIIEAINNKFWESGNQKNGLDPFKAAIGKYLYENINNLDYSINEHIKLIQFHPAYTYEDFVRGITAKSNGNSIEYKTENKLLASFAEKALKNYDDSRKDSKSISEEQSIESNFDDFVDYIQDEIDKNGKFSISNLAYINQVEEDAFRYTGDNWSTTFRIPFAEILKLHKLNVRERKDIKKESSVIGRAKQHATYYFNLLEKFRAFIPKVLVVDDQLSINENKYVLIIDEINRANLPAVLGELIYALEYRGKTVKSMYDIEGDYSLIIPQNLYIIGTMNTSDRSVGHIDYAIRRRFAFVDILPKVLEIDNFQLDFFRNVSELFISNFDDYLKNLEIPLKKSEHLSEEFRPEDVWLGHSYFISNDADFNFRKKYEIKPILKEYLKDGILNQSALEIINNL